MNRLQFSIVALVLSLCLFFNIERLDFGQENVVNLQSFVYFLAAFAALSIISLRSFWPRRPYTSFLLFGIPYLSLKSVYLYAAPPSDNTYIFLLTTELSFLVLVIWLAHWVTHNLHEFEESEIRQVLDETITSIQPVQTSNDARKVIDAEFARSRQSERPMSVIVVESEIDSHLATLDSFRQKILSEVAERYARLQLTQLLRKRLRLIDIISEDRVPGRYLILCPEVEQEYAEAIARQLEDKIAEELGIPARCGIAAFPHDGYTFDGLVEEAVTQLQHSSVASTQSSDTKTTDAQSSGGQSSDTNQLSVNHAPLAEKNSTVENGTLSRSR
ncbi:hypothetical protein KFU94_58965 [Chloroflexi bacterium TSY]|nr:hypothetical protein [Chloroflexi bacterium TSY]